MIGEKAAIFTGENSKYVETFGFPFIIAVRDHDRASSLKASHQRLVTSAEGDFAEACHQANRIAYHRITELFST